MKGFIFMNNLSESNKWIEFAENDYEAVLLLQKNNKPLLEIICFHCQQCAEKYLKAFLIKNNGEIRKTYDLEVILRYSIQIDQEFTQIKDHCIDLTDYAVGTRYPYSIEIEFSDMIKAVKDMEIIRKFIRKKLKIM